MATYKLYIMQTSFDGLNYTKSSPVDTLASYNVVCSSFPFKLFPESKDLATENWAGSHGLDAYFPQSNMIKDYDIDVDFLYVGTHAQMRTQIEQFVKFLHGLSGPTIGDTTGQAIGSRLVVYDEYTQIGRKDLHADRVEFGGWWDMPDFDTDAIADFKVKFHVYDPVTDVTPTISNGQIITMTWPE